MGRPNNAARRWGRIMVPGKMQVKAMNSYIKFLVGVSCIFSFTSCSSNEALYKELKRPVEYYSYSEKRFPREPVYSRLMWSHLPRPVVSKSHNRDVRDNKAPLLSPELEFHMEEVTLQEALEALGSTIGYRVIYPNYLGSRLVSLKMSGRVDEIVRELCKQGQVMVRMDSKQRVISVLEGRREKGLPMGS